MIESLVAHYITTKVLALEKVETLNLHILESYHKNACDQNQLLVT